MQQNQSVEAFGYRQELRRSLSLTDLLVYGLVYISPTAPIAVFGIVFNASKGMVPLIYLVGLMAMVFTAFSYMAMSKVYPVAGSVYAYASRSISPAAGFFAGWAILLDYLLLPALAIIAAAIAVHAVLPVVPAWVWVVSLVVLGTIVNYFGIEATARANMVLLVFQMVVLVIFAGAAVLGLMQGTAHAHLSTRPFYDPATIDPAIVFGAVSLGALSYLGFDAISTLSEEARDGSRAVSRATILSLILAAALFVAQTWLASLFVLDTKAFANGDAANSAFYDISQTIGGYGLKLVVAVAGILFGAIASALSAQAATARLLYGMARDGKLPAFLARVHPERKVPEGAVFVVALITLAIGLLLVSQFDLITSIVCFGALIGFMVVNLCVPIRFWRDPQRSWLKHIVSPALGFLITGYVLWNAELNAKEVGLGWLAVGAAFFFVLRWMGKSTDLPADMPVEPPPL
ncbi:MAG TPA: APC family permease [Rhizomicrobium sp.]|jgi:amino acid transporter